MRWLLDHGAVVICAGGGGIPTMYAPDADRLLVGVEAVIDKDLASSLLARELGADLFVMATDVDGVYRDWGTPTQARIGPDDARRAGRDGLAGGLDGAEGRRGRPNSSTATGKRAAIGSLEDIDALVDGSGGTQVVRGIARMTTFGVHSEVGKLRQVIVHRPELSLKRLTPGNHDELLFDDVLWVERAQWEHDQFVARMRERGVEVLYVQDLLSEALAAERGRPATRIIAIVASEYRRRAEPRRARSRRA